MKIRKFINGLRKKGHYYFTIQEAKKALNLSKASILNSIHRLKLNNEIASPVNGFYIIVPPEYQAYGCLPADMFIANLMKHLNLPYYVSFLSAAQFYGASHQKPQRFQVVTIKNRRSIQCGRIYIEFIANQNTNRIPTRNFNTKTGVIAVATPEALAMDLIMAPQHAAGIHNIATIFNELTEKIDADRLIELNELYSQLFLMQRLGYLFEFLGFEKTASKVARFLADKELHWAKLVPSKAYTALSRNKKWRIIVNVDVEPDE